MTLYPERRRDAIRAHGLNPYETEFSWISHNCVSCEAPEVLVRDASQACDPYYFCSDCGRAWYRSDEGEVPG